VFGRWGRFVVRRPWWVIGGWLVGVSLIIGFLPSLSDITSADQGSFLPGTYESVRAIDLAKTAFPQQATSTAIVVVKRADAAPLTATDQIARLREEARAGQPPRGAAALGVSHAGPSIAAAGLILAGTFAALALAPVSFLQQIGFSVAVGILLSAFVMSMFLVPSLTALIGHAAWWPGHSDVEKGRTGEHLVSEPQPDPIAGRSIGDR
jgi:uncharacterized membrane protein YdfJ with MMPL/SSD domain